MIVISFFFHSRPAPRKKKVKGGEEESRLKRGERDPSAKACGEKKGRGGMGGGGDDCGFKFSQRVRRKRGRGEENSGPARRKKKKKEKKRR